MAEFLWPVIVFCYTFFCGSYTFNIDTKYAIVKEGPKSDYYFGYSVAQHSTNNDQLHDQILVGAPQAGSLSPFLGSFERTGALYSCPINLQDAQSKTDGCAELPYPNSSNLINNYNRNLDLAENKTDMWLGVNIRSAGAGKKVVACGHRYKIVEEAVNVYGLGVCYYYNPDLTLAAEDSSKLPCSGEDLVGTGDQQNSITGEFGLCAAGMGLAAADNDIIYGLPGAGIWRGSAYWSKSPTGVRDFPINKKVDPTPEEDEKRVTSPYAYLGSSAIIVVNLIHDRIKVAAVGAPRQKGNGAVIIFALNQEDGVFEEKKRFDGDQFSSGFGHSVATVDILMDEHPSLLVGAPYYRPVAGEDKDSSRMIGGAVYIYYNYGSGVVATSQEIITPGACPYGISISECNNAQFGYAVTTLGDINGDGREDVAIGAPFYGKGAVYIYNGMSNAQLSKEPSQVIMASELEFNFLSREISGFGIALSGGHDMDGQGHTDLLIGAHDSSHITVFRSRPVITIKGVINIITSEVKLKEPECVGEGGSQCIDYEMCFTASFTDSNRNSNTERVSIEYTLVGDSGYEFPNNRRVDFKSNADNLGSVRTGSKDVAVNQVEVCESQQVYLLDTENLLNPIEFNLTYKLSAPSAVQYENINTFPIIDAYASSAPISSIDFERQCRTPNCETDLAVSAMFTDVENVIAVTDPTRPDSEEYVFDSNKVDKLELSVKLVVDSSLDRAYFSGLKVSLPPELSYSGVAPTQEESTSCSGNEETNAVACSFGRSILEGEEREVRLTLGYRNLGPTFATINITASTQSTDILEANNLAVLKIKVNIVTDLELLGSVTKGDNVEYGGDGIIKGASAMTRDDEIGEAVQHTYTIINSGDFGVVSRVILVVQWPYEIAASGEYLLYMTTFPKLDIPSGKGQCAVPDTFINSLSLQIVDELGDVSDSTTQRYKRQVIQQEEEPKTSASTDGSARTVAQLNCYDGSAKCFDITCEFLDVNPGDVIRVRLNSRLWNSSLVNLYSDVDVVQITSTGQLTIDPSAEVSQTNIKNDGRNVTTEAISVSTQTPSKPIPYWIIIVSVAAGLIVLIIIIVILWKCGFFKRDRPQMHAAKVERQKEGAKYSEVPQADPEHMT